MYFKNNVVAHCS